jgi:hypothetical protein
MRLHITLLNQFHVSDGTKLLLMNNPGNASRHGTCLLLMRNPGFASCLRNKWVTYELKECACWQVVQFCLLDGHHLAASDGLEGDLKMMGLVGLSDPPIPLF